MTLGEGQRHFARTATSVPKEIQLRLPKSNWSCLEVRNTNSISQCKYTSTTEKRFALTIREFQI